ncbi:LysR family transcriptional regulator [Reinekea marinisedimentorum]|uniref:DNA-binding transcriptional LysR family regulator n=1 Tax=Reinekea marinisedimentorum TaxID=230495 RepID=A0A4R3IC28_9GAMM|nr:LysR family transcriptional regulator [Reinekea marinisedimentorum]TCS43175.1 DNA-binding transcriptional LysR family regulator [Reinekea marinisedimentorum]
MNIEHLKLFVRLASTFNISQAGLELGLSPAVASAYLNKLEQNLGVRLLHRTTRKVSLTEEGKAFLPHAEEVLGSIEAARAAVGAGESSPGGTLRVTAPASFGRMHLVPALRSFMDKYPALNVDLRLSDAIIDMVEGGFDVAIRNAALKDSSMIARKLATDERILCASPQYLAEHGIPETPEDLKHHQCIHIMGLENLNFRSDKGTQTIKTKSRLRTDNGEAMRDACAAGLGISVNSKWSAYQLLAEGKLVQVLPDYPLDTDAAIWALYPSSRLLAPKVRVFIDHFAELFGEAPYWQ